MHSCERLQAEFNLSDGSDTGQDWTAARLDALLQSGAAEGLFRRYAECVRGCATNMLTGRTCGAGAPPPHAPERALALLRTQFAFVGITERWNETQDLWQALFGGVYPSGVRGMVRTSPFAAFRSTFEGWARELVDDADEVLYAAARQWFEQRLSAVRQRLPL